MTVPLHYIFSSSHNPGILNILKSTTENLFFLHSKFNDLQILAANYPIFLIYILIKSKKPLQ